MEDDPAGRASSADYVRTRDSRWEARTRNATLKTTHALAEMVGVEAMDLLPPMSEVSGNP